MFVAARSSQDSTCCARATKSARSNSLQQIGVALLMFKAQRQVRLPREAVALI